MKRSLLVIVAVVLLTVAAFAAPAGACHADITGCGDPTKTTVYPGK